MEKERTKQEIEEQELANKLEPLFKERFALDLKRGEGVTLEKKRIPTLGIELMK